MLNIRCGVAPDDSTPPDNNEWPVLKAVVNPQFNSDDLKKSLSQPGHLHIFASPTAVHFFVRVWTALDESTKKTSSSLDMLACGVGNTTDDAARSLRERKVSLRWSVPALASPNLRENGLSWTLGQLEKQGLIPRHTLHLWTKTWSTSEKIMRELKAARQWSSWDIHTHEIYSLAANTDPIPPEIVLALTAKSPICFGVKSAEVLDATVAALLHHTRLSSPQQLSRSIQFSVWEKGALQRAQQLFLQSRLIPWSQFDPLADATAQD